MVCGLQVVLLLRNGSGGHAGFAFTPMGRPGDLPPENPPPPAAAPRDVVAAPIPAPAAAKVGYQEVCSAIVVFEGMDELKLDARQKSQMLPSVRRLDRLAREMRLAQAELLRLLNEKQRAYVLSHRDELFKEGSTPGSPPLTRAMQVLAPH